MWESAFAAALGAVAVVCVIGFFICEWLEDR